MIEAGAEFSERRAGRCAEVFVEVTVDGDG